LCIIIFYWRLYRELFAFGNFTSFPEETSEFMLFLAAL
jgi:hypothetical protein